MLTVTFFVQSAEHAGGSCTLYRLCGKQLHRTSFMRSHAKMVGSSL